MSSNMILKEIHKMGDSVYIIIPKPLAQLLGLEEGTKIGLELQDSNLILKPIQEVPA